MNSFLLLHIDVEFIAGAICIGNGKYLPISKENDEFLWLYFYNDPTSNRVTFGKGYKKHFNNLEINYFGRFFETITDENNNFLYHGNPHPIIELLEYSGLIDLLKERYAQVTFNPPVEIPTLVTFSQSINDLSKVKTIEYLSLRNFSIKSYSIPISELICYHYWKEGQIDEKKGKTVVLLKATNSTLHLSKLIFTDAYFLNDERSSVPYKGIGFDPRIKSIVRFVVTEVNKSTGVLSCQDEIDLECERYETVAEDWLKRLDVISGNSPINIKSINLTPAPSMLKSVLVRKMDVENDTFFYINELERIYTTFVHDNIESKDSITSVILFGDCFKNELIKQKFKTIVENDRLIISTSSSLLSILSSYPLIDISRYADERGRIEARAKSENEEKLHAIAFEAEKKAQEERENERQKELKRVEENKQKAKRYFEKAKELNSENNLFDAISNIENAKELDPTNKEVSIFNDLLIKKKIELELKTEQYKLCLTEAEKLIKNKNYSDALLKFELAKSLLDSPGIRNSIVDIKSKIIEYEKGLKDIKKRIEKIEDLIEQSYFIDAKALIEEALVIDNENVVLNKKLIEINALIKQQDAELQNLIDQAEFFFINNKFENAEELYKKIINCKPNDSFCLSRLSEIKDIKFQIEKKKTEYNELLKVADSDFLNKSWTKAKESYKSASLIIPVDDYLRRQIELCNQNIIEEKNIFSDLCFSARDKMLKGKIEEALSLINQALALYPYDSNAKKLKFNIEFSKSQGLTTSNNSEKQREIKILKSYRNIDKSITLNDPMVKHLGDLEDRSFIKHKDTINAIHFDRKDAEPFISIKSHKNKILREGDDFLKSKLHNGSLVNTTQSKKEKVKDEPFISKENFIIKTEKKVEGDFFLKKRENNKGEDDFLNKKN